MCHGLHREREEHPEHAVYHEDHETTVRLGAVWSYPSLEWSGQWWREQAVAAAREKGRFFYLYVHVAVASSL
jgi:hypothetical protein